MKLTFNHIAILFILLSGLIAANVYQWQHPQVVEVPAGPAQIDSSAWVSRTAYLTRGGIIDSLHAQNEALARKIDRSRDKISSYTKIIGTLNLQVDSLQARPPVRLDSLFKFAEHAALPDTSITFRQTVSDSLFTLQSTLQFRGPTLRNTLSATQNRPIRLDLAHTFNQDRTRQLTYLTSPDFANLTYSSYTQLKPKRRLPRFWLGLSAGIAATLTGIFILK